MAQILFRDGTYLELIAFVHDHPERRKGYWWDMPYGIVDLALTTCEPSDLLALQRRLAALGSRVSYATTREGGQVTLGTQELKWRVDFSDGVQRGAMRFFWEDLTPHFRRVPAVNGNTHHPCDADGISGIDDEVAESLYKRLVPALAAATNSSATKRGRHPFATPFEIGRLEQETVRLVKRLRDDDKQVQMKVMIQCLGRKPNVERRVGDGVVLIDFVNGESSKVVREE
ncbi:hypothetical protein D0869_06922 [Hortaea werneckii]|uniref:Glyoxalase-like domain-containing protein n=1 Tax=Hortaea werneckii TaxID=91943 RepID=A0A3M6WSW8_HORWE|nr:hypothetical protein D0869_06922 [Hortaea werneckii]